VKKTALLLALAFVFSLPLRAAEALEQQFQTPPQSAKPQTWWHWISGSVSKEGITADLEAMKRIGLGGAQIFSVDVSHVKGSVVFMSPEWRELVKHTLSEAERLNLKISMQSCDGWSQSGGPWVQPSQAMQEVVWSETQVEGGKTIPLSLPQPETKLGYYQDIALIACKSNDARVNDAAARAGMAVKMHLPFANPAEALAGTDAKDIIDLTGKTEWEAPEGQWTLLRIGHTSTGMTTKPSTSPGLECDKMSAEAVNSHIDQMFNPVWEDSPDKAGGTFKFLLLDSWEAECANWTPRMAEEFQKRRGYDLRPWLPALTGRIVGNQEETERFLWDYRLTIGELVAENHYGVFQKRAREKGMGLMSEAAGLNMPTVAEQLLCKKHTDVPMGEFWIGSPERFVNDLREAASAAHIYGQNIAAAEAFTSGPPSLWRIDPYALKGLGDRAFCTGINLLVFHRYAHQPWLDRKPGISMGEWGINFERTNTWWNQGSAWIDYLTRCQWLLQQGRFHADLCYFYGEGAPLGLLHNELTPAVPKGFDYDVCNADALLNLMEVKDGRVTTPSGMSYRVLVLPPRDRMTLPILQKIARLVREGAVVYGPKPLRSPSLAGYPAVDQEIAKLADEVWGNCDGKTVTEHAYGAGKVVWGEPIEQVLGVPPDFSSSNGNLLFIHRQDADADIYFVSNQGKQAVTAECSFRVAGKVPEFWHPDTGRRERVALYSEKDGVTKLPVALDPSGSVFVVFKKEPTPVPHLVSFQVNGRNPFAEPGKVGIPEFSKNGITFTSTEPGTYQGTTASGATVKGEIPAPPAPVVIEGPWEVEFPPLAPSDKEPLKTTFGKLASWSDSTVERIQHFSGTATYHKTFQVSGLKSPTSRVFLDLGNVKNLAEATLNGKPLRILWKEPFRVDVTDALVEGKNELAIQITNLWVNRLIGDEKLPEKDRATWTSGHPIKATDPLLPSGLLGPVSLRPVTTIQIK